MLEIILFLAGTFLGWYGKDWITKFREKNLSERADSRIKTMHSNELKSWLIDYYIKSGDKNFLFNAKINGISKVVPFLTKDNWYNQEFDLNNLITITNDDINSIVQINDKFINKRVLLGQNLWNDPIICLRRIVDSKSSTQIEAMRCGFFHYVCRSGFLEDETIKIIQGKKKESTISE